jgi:hypothetical protein
MPHLALPSRSKFFLLAGLLVCIVLLLTACPVGCCAQSPTVNLCQQLGGQYESTEIADYNHTDVQHEEYCVLAAADLCRLHYTNAGIPSCTTVPVEWQPLAPDVHNAISAALTQSFTQTYPSTVKVVELVGKVGRGAELRFESPQLLDAQVEDVAATVNAALTSIGWHEMAASVTTEWADDLRKTVRYRSQFTNGANLCQSTVDWVPLADLISCPEDNPYPDCMLNSPESCCAASMTPLATKQTQ